MTVKRLALIGLTTAIAISTTSVYASFVKDSYIVTFKKSAKMEVPLIYPPNKMNRGKVPFGEHSSGQSKEQLADQLELNGKVLSIYDTINAANIEMTADEAHKLSFDKRVLRVQQDRVLTSNLQNNPGWALDRLDEQTPALDNTYNDTPNTGAGRTIYILDSGLDLANANVVAEFTSPPPVGNRASVIWDVNGGTGADCFGHGTQVASVAAGNTYGAAKGATIIAAKITNDTPIPCIGDTTISTSIDAFNWLATNVPAGTIVNWSYGFRDTGCSNTFIDIDLEASIQAAHNAGVIVVVSAGNDACDTANYSPTRIAEAFVVGATSQNRITLPPPLTPEDEKAWFSRTGSNISTFAPGESVLALDFDGTQTTLNGTSFAAPYIAGIFAVACQVAAPFCDTATSAAPLYQALRNTGQIGTVTNTGGGALPAGTTSRFIWKQW